MYRVVSKIAHHPASTPNTLAWVQAININSRTTWNVIFDSTEGYVSARGFATRDHAVQYILQARGADG